MVDIQYILIKRNGRHAPNRTVDLDACLNGREVVYNDGSAEGH